MPLACGGAHSLAAIGVQAELLRMHHLPALHHLHALSLLAAAQAGCQLLMLIPG